MRVAREQAGELRLGQAHLGQGGFHAAAALGGVDARFMHQQPLAHDFFDREARRERRERVLEHHLHPLAQCLVGGCVAGGRLLPGLAVDLQIALRRQQAQDGLRQGGLARARFAHHAQRLPRQQLQIGPLHGHKLALLEPAAHARQRRGVRHAQLARLHHGRCTCGRGRLHHIAPGLAGDQAARVGVLRVGEHLGHSALLYQHALLHHRHAVGKAAHQVQIVRDEQHGHAGLALQVRKQIQNLPAQRHIERCGGLIGQQQLGFAGQGHGDHGALALPARKLVRKAARAPGRLRNAGFC